MAKVLGKDDLSPSTLSQLVYTRQVIDETLRMTRYSISLPPALLNKNPLIIVKKCTLILYWFSITLQTGQLCCSDIIQGGDDWWPRDPAWYSSASGYPRHLP